MMTEVKRPNEKVLNPKLEFLVDAISAKKPPMRYWLSVPEFSDKISALYDAGTDLDDALILQVMKEVYAQKALDALSAESDFRFSFAKRAITQIENAIRSDEEVDKEREIDWMSLPVANPQLLFMLKTIHVHPVGMRYWLTVPEFSDAMTELLDKHAKIDDEAVLPVMQDVYDEKIRQIERGEQVVFHKRMARHAIRQLQKALAGK